MWDLSGPGLDPVSPALAGGLLTTVPPGKSHEYSFESGCPASLILFPSWLPLALALEMPELDELQGWAGIASVGLGSPLGSSLLLREGRVIIQGKTSGPGEMSRQRLGLLEMCPVGHVLNERCARHWPALEAARRYWGHRLSSESLHLRG